MIMSSTRCYNQLSSTSNSNENGYNDKYKTEKLQTAAIMYEFLDVTAENDRNLTHLRRIQIRKELSECIRQEDFNPVQVGRFN